MKKIIILLLLSLPAICFAQNGSFFIYTGTAAKQPYKIHKSVPPKSDTLPEKHFKYCASEAADTNTIYWNDPWPGSTVNSLPMTKAKFFFRNGGRFDSVNAFDNTPQIEQRLCEIYTRELCNGLLSITEYYDLIKGLEEIFSRRKTYSELSNRLRTRVSLWIDSLPYRPNLNVPSYPNR